MPQHSVPRKLSQKSSSARCFTASHVQSSAAIFSWQSLNLLPLPHGHCRRLLATRPFLTIRTRFQLIASTSGTGRPRAIRSNSYCALAAPSPCGQSWPLNHSPVRSAITCNRRNPSNSPHHFVANSADEGGVRPVGDHPRQKEPSELMCLCGQKLGSRPSIERTTSPLGRWEILIRNEVVEPSASGREMEQTRDPELCSLTVIPSNSDDAVRR